MKDKVKSNTNQTDTDDLLYISDISNNHTRETEGEEVTLTEIIIGIALFLSGIGFFFSAVRNIESHRTFLTGSLTFIFLFIVLPLYSTIKSTRNQDSISLRERLMLVLHIITGLLITLALYRMVYLPFREFENYFWIFYFAFIVLWFTIFQRSVSKTIERIKRSRDSEGSIFNYLGPFIAFILGLAITMQPMSQFYRADKEMTLNNLKTPYEIEIFSVNQELMDNDKDVYIDKITSITDETFIKNLYVDINNLEANNIRFLGIIKYLLRKEKSHSYYKLKFIYKDKNGRKIRLDEEHDLSDGYIHELNIFNDGKVVVENKELDFSIFRSDRREFYKLPLPNSALSHFNNMILKIENK